MAAVGGVDPGLGFLVLGVLVVVMLTCVIRKRRQTEGTYRPSAEEVKQVKSRGPERPGLALPLPKEERLI